MIINLIRRSGEDIGVRNFVIVGCISIAILRTHRCDKWQPWNYRCNLDRTICISRCDDDFLGILIRIDHSYECVSQPFNCHSRGDVIGRNRVANRIAINGQAINIPGLDRPAEGNASRLTCDHYRVGQGAIGCQGLGKVQGNNTSAPVRVGDRRRASLAVTGSINLRSVDGKVFNNA